MGRPRKESTPFSIRMDKAVFNRLAEYCNVTGIAKTVAIEKAVDRYLDEYDEQQRILKSVNE